MFLEAVTCRNTQRAPVWIMRQAGRYMPEYRALRAKYSFLTMCETPELVAKVTLLPIDIIGMDAAILFSDILMIPKALGVGVRFEDGTGPIIERPLHTGQDIEALPAVEVESSLSFVADGIRLLKPALKVPLIGFCGAPFTVASYMIEGGSTRDFKKTKRWLFQNPDSFHKLLDKITAASIDYLKMQINAGVQAVQIFDSWAHVLSPEMFRSCSLHYFKRIIDALQDTKIPVILFGKGFGPHLKELAAIAPAAISLDWSIDLQAARQIVPKTVALQGNLDPDVLYAPPDVIRREVSKQLHAMKGEPGYVFNLGHGIHPDIPVDHVKALVETVKSF